MKSELSGKFGTNGEEMCVRILVEIHRKSVHVSNLCVCFSCFRLQQLKP